MKKSHGIWIGIAIVVLGTATYFLYRNNKMRYAQAIKDVEASTQPLAFLLTLDEGYLKAWAIAADKGQSSFVYQGANYSSQGGKKI